MQNNEILQLMLYLICLITLAPILGIWMAQVFEGKKHFLHTSLSWLEKLIYRFSGLAEQNEMNWKEYLKSLLWFNGVGFLFVLLLQVFQRYLPLNPQNFSGLSLPLSLNTAVSFMTNTNWQAYGGESTMSYLTQMLGLGVQNFLSAATGVAVFLALVRGLRSRSGASLGNFWYDLTRSVVYILLPLSFVMAVTLVGQGVVQNFSTYQRAHTLEGTEQLIPGGPAASQIAIKQLGTNGGGFFNTNSAHPFENPTPFSNFLEMLAILLLPGALTFTFGKMIGSLRQGGLLFMLMLSVWLAGLTLSIYSEYQRNPISQRVSSMEGKEQRIGIVNSLIWATATTVASNGSVNAMHSSLSPLAGGVAMFNIMLGEIIFGGIGSGMYGMLLFVLMTVFLAGLMVGRSPEYLGKKIEASEMKWVVLGILGPCAVILIGSAISAVLPSALTSLSHHGAHGFSEILYAWSSAAGNNGSAFAGLNANTVFYDVGLAIAMLIGRFVVIVPALIIAGSLAVKKITPNGGGTFSTDSPIFAFLLLGVILIVGALTFLPALTLGPIVEHFLMLKSI